MRISSQELQRLVIAEGLASGLASSGVAASAQTITAPAATTTPEAKDVSMSTLHDKAKRQAELTQAKADPRRVAFRYLASLP